MLLNIWRAKPIWGITLKNGAIVWCIANISCLDKDKSQKEGIQKDNLNILSDPENNIPKRVLG